jgi:phosphoglycerol transferase
MTKNIAPVITPVNWGLIKSDPAKFWKTFSWVVPVVALGVIWVMTRIMTVLPKILGDELIYSNNARHTALADSSVPNYLFNLLYSTTSNFGYGFYTAAKVYNLFFLVALSAVVYLAARLIARPGVSFVVALIALVGPISAYASYFTPEMMFYFGCSVVIYFVLKFHRGTPASLWAILGLGLGLVSLVKPHALFLSAPIVIYIVFLAFSLDGKKFVAAVARTLAFGLGLAIAKFGLGYALAGSKAFALFGGSYDNSATNALASGSQVPTEVSNDPLVGGIVQNGLVGVVTWQTLFHLSYMLMFIGVPFVLAGIQTVRAVKSKGELYLPTKISFFLFMALIALVLVSAVFVAYSSSFGETLQNRVMIRYYEYLLPFLPLALLPVGNHIPKLKVSAKWAIMLGVSIWLVISLPNMSSIVPPLFTDSSMMAAALKSGIPLAIFAVIGIVMLAYWLFKPETGTQVWLFAFAPVTVLIYAISCYTNMTVPSSNVGMYTGSSRWVHENISAKDREDIIVIGNNMQNVQAAQLWLDTPSSTGKMVAEGEEVNINDFPEKGQLILAIGKVALTGDGFIVKQEDSWALIKNATAAEAAQDESGD